MQEEYSQNTLLDIFVTLRRHLFGMSVIFIIIVSIVTVWTLTQTPIYEVMSSVMVKYGREYFYHPVRKSGEIQPQYTFKTTPWINTELEIFRSKKLAEKVVDSIGLEQLFPKLADKVEDKKRLLAMAVSRFGKKLQLFHVKESNVINVSFQHQDPELAVQAVSLLTELFKERHLQIFKNPQTAFLEKQVGVYSRQLQDAENALTLYKQENKIFSPKHQQRVLMEQYVQINTMLIEVRSNLSKLEENASALERERERVPERILRTEESTTRLNDQSEARSSSILLDLQLEEKQLLEQYPEDNRLVIAVRKKIALVRDFLAEQGESSQEKVSTGQNSVYQELSFKLAVVRAEYVGQKEKTAELERQLKGLEAQLQKLSEQEVKFRELSIQVDTTAQTYKNFVGRLEDSRIRDAMDRQKMVNVVVIEKPMVPIKPIKPRKKLNVLVGIILGAACSLSYGLLIENVKGRKI